MYVWRMNLHMLYVNVTYGINILTQSLVEILHLNYQKGLNLDFCTEIVHNAPYIESWEKLDKFFSD